MTSLAGSASPWLADGEEVEDAEIVHEVAPAAAIRVVLIRAAALASLGRAIAALTAVVRLGVSQGAVISISAGWGEQCFARAEVARLHAALQVARHHRVTVVGSSGDFGTVTPCPGSGIA